MKPGAAPGASRTARSAAAALPFSAEDGSALTDLAGYRIYYGSRSRDYPNTIELNDAAIDNHSFTVPSGDQFVTMTAVDSEGNESACSNEIVCTVP